MASKMHLVLVIFLMAGVASALAEKDTGLDKDLLTALNHARKLWGGPLRKPLTFGDGYGVPPTAGYGVTSSPASRGPASITDAPSTSGSQSAGTSQQVGDNKSRSGSTAAAVVGSLLAVVVIAVLSVFAYKQWKGKGQDRQRYSTYSTFDNEMGQIRYT